MTPLQEQFEKETGIIIVRTLEQLDELEKDQNKECINLGAVENKYTAWLEAWNEKLKTDNENLSRENVSLWDRR